MNKNIYYYFLITLFILSGCSSYNSKINSSNDIRNLSALEWRLRGKKKSDELLYSREKTLVSQYQYNEKLTKTNNELEIEIKNKQKIIQNLTNSIEYYYSNIEKNINVTENINRIDKSLKTIIMEADNIIRYINKGKLIYRIRQAKTLRRKISLIKRGSTKLAAKSFLRAIPQIRLFSILWDIIDFLKPIKSYRRIR